MKVTQSDLFELAAGPHLSPEQRRRLIPVRAKKRGHAWQPGSGPKGETCGSCGNLHRHKGASKTFLKCELMRAAWTHGYGTDVLARDPACKKWKSKDEEQATE